MHVRGFGIDADLPRGWEGALRSAPNAPGTLDEARTLSVTTNPVFHAGTFPLPVDRGDFGSGAVETMSQGDTFVALLEYDAEEADTPLFEAQGLPRRLDPRRFTGRSLQRVLPGQAGYQAFFTEGGRAFCLYVVLGDEEDKLVQVRRVEQMLAGITIEPRTRAAGPTAEPAEAREPAGPTAEPAEARELAEATDDADQGDDL